MQADDWGGLRPEQVAKWINFDRSNPNWDYAANAGVTMATKQAEGVAYLWNLLSRHGVALLADEVGMGKTIQALGVAALLWKMKPDARVLVMAHNHEICAHWRREYNAFVRFHYREIDHCVKYADNAGPMQSIHAFGRLEELAKSIEISPPHLSLTTIHSLSGLVPSTEKEGDVLKIASANAKAIHRRIKSALGDGGFDLLIIDEAHYFRNVSGDSQRVAAAKALFGGIDSPLAKKVLMLTATPSHTGLGDVENILSYFVDVESESDRAVPALMRKYGLRRLRLMEGRGGHYTKRHYRVEEVQPSDFIKRPKSEMFFALYQKRLVDLLKKLKEEKKSAMYGYLEGFESIGRNDADSVSSEELEEAQDNAGRNDYKEAKDTDLLRKLTRQYRDEFHEFPEHPKYSDLVERCLPSELFKGEGDLHEDKHLVFVRRIPSVRELTQRINRAYDELLLARICAAFGVDTNDARVKKWKNGENGGWSRSGFDEMVNSLGAVEADEDIDADEELEETQNIEFGRDERFGSRISDLFVVKKGVNGRTVCSNVSLRFRKPESLFSMFLEPARDYRGSGYHEYYEGTGSGRKRADYGNAALDARLASHESYVKTAEQRGFADRETKQFDAEIQTAWTMIYPLLDSERRARLDKWADKRRDVSENFANYIKTGFMFASPVVVELFAWYTEFNRGHVSTKKVGEADVQKRYGAFIEFVSPKISTSLMFAYFKAALDTFDVLCEKIIDHKLGEWMKPWRSLSSLQDPAAFASGETSNRDRLILGFNSPFYPNVLVATSVFQEGVNLHMQCQKVHHYGIAWTPGDNEQRVGRIDRLFGKVNSLLKSDENQRLHINYPFLKDSFDEEQVASFIAKKFHVEEQMDECIQASADRVIDLTQTDWRSYLRSPDKHARRDDPYQSNFQEKSVPSSEYVPHANYGQANIVSYVATLMNRVVDQTTDSVREISQNPMYPTAILYVNPVVNMDGLVRRQPILLEKNFSAEFSSLIKREVFYLSLLSPVAKYADLLELDGGAMSRLEALYEELSQLYPLPKICLIPDAANSHFFLNVRVDLPIFIGRGQLDRLSQHELQQAYNDLRCFSDRLEYELFPDKRDLHAHKLELGEGKLATVQAGFPIRSERNHTPATSGKWFEVAGKFGTVERIKTDVVLSELSKVNTSPFIMKLGGSELFTQSLLLSGRFPFARFMPKGESCEMSIDYPSGDFSVEKRHLLESWFDAIQAE